MYSDAIVTLARDVVIRHNLFQRYSTSHSIIESIVEVWGGRNSRARRTGIWDNVFLDMDNVRLWQIGTAPDHLPVVMYPVRVGATATMTSLVNNVFINRTKWTYRGRPMGEIGHDDCMIAVGGSNTSIGLSGNECYLDPGPLTATTAGVTMSSPIPAPSCRCP